MNVANLIDLTKRLLGMNEMLDKYAHYPPSPFFVTQVQRKQDLCEMIRKVIHSDEPKTEYPSSELTETVKGCTCGRQLYQDVQGTGHAHAVFCQCQNKVIDYEVIETKPLL